MKTEVIKYDFIQIRKDPMLLASIIAPLLFWILLRFGFPALSSLLYSLWQLDIDPWFTRAGIFFLALIPMMFGMAYGFMLLDERDEGIITAISVTPLGRQGYLLLRMGIPVLLSVAIILIFCITLNIPGTLNIGQLGIMAAILSLNGPVLLLMLGAFARNKVEGVAISKGFGILLSALIIDFVAPAPYNWLGGFSPLFWAERALLSTGLPAFALYGSVALVMHLGLGWLLFIKFRKKV